MSKQKWPVAEETPPAKPRGSRPYEINIDLTDLAPRIEGDVLKITMMGDIPEYAALHEFTAQFGLSPLERDQLGDEIALLVNRTVVIKALRERISL